MAAYYGAVVVVGTGLVRDALKSDWHPVGLAVRAASALKGLGLPGHRKLFATPRQVCRCQPPQLRA